MKKSILFKVLCVVFAVVMTACVFAACGGGEGGGDNGGNGGNGEAKEVKGETSTWGRYGAILVPEGMILKGGNILDANDPTIVSVKDNDNDLHYVMCTLFDEDSCKSSVESTKSINSGEDVTIDINGVTWTGVKYTAFSSEGFSMYAQVDGEWVLASGFYHGYDSEIAKAILGSLKINPAE